MRFVGWSWAKEKSTAPNDKNNTTALLLETSIKGPLQILPKLAFSTLQEFAGMSTQDISADDSPIGREPGGCRESINKRKYRLFLQQNSPVWFRLTHVNLLPRRCVRSPGNEAALPDFTPLLPSLRGESRSTHGIIHGPKRRGVALSGSSETEPSRVLNQSTL